MAKNLNHDAPFILASGALFLSFPFFPFIPFFLFFLFFLSFLSFLYSYLRFLSFLQMSVRSSMTTHLPSSLPERLRAVLELRVGSITCPVDVEAALGRISYFRASKPATSTRFANITASHEGFRREDGWRGSGSRNNDGFEVWHSRRRVPPQRPAYTPGSRGPVTAFTPRVAEPRSTESVEPALAIAMGGAGATIVEAPAKFSSAGVKAMDVEDRMLARVKGKINRIGHSTYDATKVFMEQILSSDDTEFLDELMKYVFQKAATESSFCPLYAKLIHELADEFTHFRTVMVNLFRDYTAIFSEVTTAPDPGTESYRAFVEAQERKKFRRGYSQFVAELVKMGEVDNTAFANLIQQVVTVLETIHTEASNSLLCEEYIDCLANMCKSASGILRVASWAPEVKARLASLIALPKTTVPGFTNKGRFALMDLVDAANRGWVYR